MFFMVISSTSPLLFKSDTVSVIDSAIECLMFLPP